ncbi:MAG: MBL fold metallo-hydrolase [Myxococcales bacterium]|nr:MAG: MBL fold metallo-hydrolase [Myxococcales bacterium]
MRVTILGSGSEGNALLLESLATTVLVDAGLSYRMLVQRFAAIGRAAPNDVSAVLVTHSHSDHAANASTYAARFDCPVRATEVTARGMRLRASTRVETFSAGRAFRIGDISIRTRAIPHDAPQVALLFETRVTSVGLVTDLGHVPEGLGRFLSECETLLLESNHDPDMLATGPYPAVLKRRVGGSLGHLSNAQASDLLASLDHAPREVVLMHLSETNNCPLLARSSAEAALGDRGTKLRLAKQRQPIEVGAVHESQLQLGL